MSTSTPESNTSRASGVKRKSMTSTLVNTELHNAKRAKTEESSPTETKVSKPVMVADTIYDTIVTVKVGEVEANFGIHRGLLCRASNFFQEKLASVEATEDGACRSYLYHKGRRPRESETNKNLARSSIINLYIFAERKGIALMMNTCVDTVIRKRKEGGLFPGQADVNTLWKSPGKVFMLRRLLLHIFARECNINQAIAANGSYHPKFLQGLVQILYDMKDKKATYARVDFWGKRQQYYVEDAANPLLLD
ncbi:MAG: hypothetical protein ASARMPREDX12_006620 [Alectoria sarmentosa]|nr:MAG: hypothetical protein ASARMPREDX12_006620 [Alectoria sarmentosa]